MKMHVTVVVLMLATGLSGMGTPDLPYPWLFLDRAAKVLHLTCKSPPEAHRQWAAVYDIRMSAWLHQHNMAANTSLMNMTSNMEKPKVNNLFTISQPKFEGTWLDKTASVDFFFPVTSKEVGRYFCTLVYTDSNDKRGEFTTDVAVDQTFISNNLPTDNPFVSKNNFEVGVIDADKVRVTWMKPENSKFKEASVSRKPVDIEGPYGTESLFTTNGDKHFVYDPDLVLLTKFSPDDSGNVSIVLYVKHERQSVVSYRYSCRVPYSACEDDNVFCTCCHNGTDPDRQTCPTAPADSQSLTSEGDSSTYKSLFITFLVLFLVLGLAFGIACCHNTGKCPNKCYRTSLRESIQVADPGQPGTTNNEAGTNNDDATLLPTCIVQERPPETILETIV